METTQNGTESTPEEAVHEEKVRCSTCGRVVKYPRGWIIGNNGTTVCASCYQELLFPNIKEYSMETFN